jgi:pilus assembly protein CpaF
VDEVFYVDLTPVLLVAAVAAVVAILVRWAPATLGRAVRPAVAAGPPHALRDRPTGDYGWINEPGRVFVARRGRSELTTTILTEGQIRDLVEKMLKTTGRRVDVSAPFA